MFFYPESILPSQHDSDVRKILFNYSFHFSCFSFFFNSFHHFLFTILNVFQRPKRNPRNLALSRETFPSISASHMPWIIRWEISGAAIILKTNWSSLAGNAYSSAYVANGNGTLPYAGHLATQRRLGTVTMLSLTTAAGGGGAAVASSRFTLMFTVLRNVRSWEKSR
jgi:hypothetical protein